MKLRNKKTGEIVEITMPIKNGDGWSVSASSLAELNEEWEDYEETALDEMIEKLKSDFEKYPDEWNNLEDAKKIVEKLKALTRLRGKGFKFTGFSEGSIHFTLDKEYSEFTYNGYDEGCEMYINGEVDNDLETLFGGEQ